MRAIGLLLARIIHGHPGEASVRDNPETGVIEINQYSVAQGLARDRDFSLRQGRATTAMPGRIGEER
jgi:hypothetical protein